MHRHNLPHQQQPAQHQSSTNQRFGGDVVGVYFDQQQQQQQQQQIIRNRIGSANGNSSIGGGGGCSISNNRSMSVSASSSSSRRLFTWSKVHTSGNLYSSTDFLPSSVTSASAALHSYPASPASASATASSNNVNPAGSLGSTSASGLAAGGVSGISLPPPRSGAASVVVKGKLYIFGGYGGGTGRLDDFWSYDYNTQRWEEVTVLSVEKPGCRENNGVVISDSSISIYLFGGYNGSSWLNDLWEFNIETKRWTCIQESTDVDNGRDTHVLIGNGVSNIDTMNVDAATMSAQVPGLMDAAGGNNSLITAAFGSIVRSNNTMVQGKIPSRRFGYVSVVHDGKLLVFGGFDGVRWLNDMYVFHFQTKLWTQIEARGLVPSARSCPAWAKDDTHVYIHGGYDGVERKSDFFSFDLTNYTWDEMLCLGVPPSPRYFHSCCLYNRKMYVYGGYSGSERLAEMFCYDFDTHHWSPIDCTAGDAPAGRSSLVAQVYENCIYIFGGYNGSTVLNDFYRFRLKAVDVAPPALVFDFRRLINNAELADVQFIVENKPIYAHRAVLAIRSEYFRVMLCGGMRESNMIFATQQAAQDTNMTISCPEALKTDRDDVDDSSDLPQIHHLVHQQAIELPDISYRVFLKVLEFLYTDSIGSVALDDGIQLLIASEQFMLDRLKSLCEDIMRCDIANDTVVSILVTSHRHHASFLKDIALEYILNNLTDPSIMNGLNELKAEPELLLEIIRRNTINNQIVAMPHSGNSSSNNNGLGNATFDGNMSEASAASVSNYMNQNNMSNSSNLAGPFGSNAEWSARR